MRPSRSRETNSGALPRTSFRIAESKGSVKYSAGTRQSTNDGFNTTEMSPPKPDELTSAAVRGMAFTLRDNPEYLTQFPEYLTAHKRVSTFVGLYRKRAVAEKVVYAVAVSDVVHSLAAMQHPMYPDNPFLSATECYEALTQFQLQKAEGGAFDA